MQLSTPTKFCIAIPSTLVAPFDPIGKIAHLSSYSIRALLRAPQLTIELFQKAVSPFIDNQTQLNMIGKRVSWMTPLAKESNISTIVNRELFNTTSHQCENLGH